MILFLKEDSAMRSFWHSLLAFLTLGMVSLGCSRSGTDAPPPSTTTDVTLLVPGMN